MGSRGVCLTTMPIYRTPRPQVNGRQTPFAAAVPTSFTVYPHRLKPLLASSSLDPRPATGRGRRPGETREETSPQTPYQEVGEKTRAGRWGSRPGTGFTGTGRLRPAPARGPVRLSRRVTLGLDVRGSPGPSAGWLTEWRTPICRGFHDFRGSEACAGRGSLPAPPADKPLYANHFGLAWRRGFSRLRSGVRRSRPDRRRRSRALAGVFSSRR